MTRRNFGTEGNRYGLGQAGSAQRHRFRAQVFQERNDWNRIDRSQVLGDGGMYGHVGCVNALCWGWVHNNYQLLSGSDDTRICMWGPSAEMDPTPGTPYPLELYGSIDTAHRQNIFDLKYIPHANHPTIVSVAGDSRILVYDVERLPKTTEALETPALDGRYGTGVRELHCHNDRVKKISTEDNPHVFLTASEDGTVRQHDLRAHHSCPTTITRGNCPAPLFEAPRGIELSTLSLSQLQPYLFTVAGTSQYAYLQDRRMVRHINREWRLQEEQESQVHCVRRFAMSSPSVSSGPVGSSLIRHITAVQMNPDVADELLVSFTGHSIALYSINDCPAFDGFPSPSSTGKSRLRFLDHTGSSQSTALCNEGDPGSMPDIRSTNELCLGNSDSHAATESDIAEIPQQTLMDESADSDSDMPSGSSDTEIEESSDWPFGRDDGLYHNFLSDEIFNGVPTILPRMRYAGIRNTQTVKDVTFLGPTGTSVCSGSDDGNWFVWDKSSGQLQGIWKGDEDVVNVIVQHPSLPIYAVSGIDSTVKIFAPMDSSSISNYSRMADADMVISKNIENGRSRLQGTTAIERYTAALASDAGFFDQTELAEQTGRSPAENCRLQ